MRKKAVRKSSATKAFKYPLTEGPITLSDAAARVGEICFGRPAEVSERQASTAPTIPDDEIRASKRA